MPRIEEYTERLEDLTAKSAFEFIAKPNRRDAFEYGERVGIVRGLQMARELINAMQNEEDERAKIDR
jgi:hypothetical protein